MSDNVNDCYIDLGATLLVMTWKAAMKRLIDIRDGAEVKHASIADYVGVDKPQWTVERFAQYYVELDFEDVEDLKKPHSLSKLLYRWKRDRVSFYLRLHEKLLTTLRQFIACAAEGELTEDQKDMKKQLGDDVVEGIKRFASDDTSNWHFGLC
jgi:hypothetical protein